ncbi:MAG TPA: SpoIIE family protein phosphatase [Acidimicrobiales bacterium]|nr:SpoIIE family protein phosphatase [Acidimicrobiales bacterium]
MAQGESAAFSLRGRLQVLVIGLVGILVAGGVVMLSTVAKGDDALGVIVEQLDPADQATNQLEAALVDQQAAVSGFVLTGLEETLEPYQRAVDRQVRALSTLRRTLQSRSTPRARLTAARAAIEEWRSVIVGPQLSAKRAGREAEARALSATGEGLFNAARNEVQALERSVGSELAREQRQFTAAREGITRGIAINLTVASLLVVLVTIFLRRWVTIPLHDLRQSVVAVASGDLSHEIAPSGPRELSELGESVEAMRRRILDELLESERAHEGLAQQAPVVLTLREVLAPHSVELPPGFEFAAHFEPAEGVLAGDWYDVVRLADGGIGLCVGDVSGHGAVAGIFALRAKELLLVGLRLGLTPDQALELVSDQLGELDETFLTCLVAVFHPNGSFRYANAGHPPGLLAGTREVILLPPTGPLLGPLGGTWTSRELALTSGSVLVCYTDGIIEAADAGGNEYGVERLRDCVATGRAGGPTALVEQCLAEVRAHMPDRGRDDLTLVALARP